MLSGVGTPGAIPRALAAAAFVSAGTAFALGEAAFALDVAALGLPADALPIGFVFLRTLVESKPVMPAPDAGAEKLAGGPNCASPSRVNFWKRGGLCGSVCRFGASGSGKGGVAVCATASALHSATQAARSRRAPRGVTGFKGRKRGTAVSALLPTAERRASAPFPKERSPAGSRALVNGRFVGGLRLKSRP